jgi:erythrin-vacuolar iron transport family protein
MAKEIDFAALTLQDALDLAVLIEDDAKDRYQEFAEQMDACFTPEAARFFRFMSDNEAKHGRELRTRREALFGDLPVKVRRSMIWEVEAPAYERARSFISPRRVLEIAMEAEIKAHDFFAAAIPHLVDPGVKALFEELRLEEVEHRELVAKELRKQPPDDPRDPDDFVDEPTEM